MDDQLNSLEIAQSTAESDVGRMRDDEFDSKSGSDNHEGGSGEDQDPNSRKRKKRYHHHTQHQIQEMEVFFKECPHPNDKQRKELSRELGLEPLQIKFWFQNKRTQMKECFLDYLGCLLEDDSSWCNGADSDPIHPSKSVDCKLAHLSDEVLFAEASTDSARCPYLANHEIERRKFLFGKGVFSSLLSNAVTAHATCVCEAIRSIMAVTKLEAVRFDRRIRHSRRRKQAHLTELETQICSTKIGFYSHLFILGPDSGNQVIIKLCLRCTPYNGPQFKSFQESWPVMVKPSEAEKNLVQSTTATAGAVGGLIGPYLGGARRVCEETTLVVLPMCCHCPCDMTIKKGLFHIFPLCA
ncbi:unnamed protein product [Camellia sinensis]